MNQKRKWKVWSTALLIAGMFTFAGCEKGVVEGTRETATTTATQTENHVAGEVTTYSKTDTDNDGIIQFANSLTATLTGVVVDDLGYPVSDAQVSAFGKTARTTAGGSWIIENVPVSQVVTQGALNGVSQGNAGNTSNQGGGAAPRTVATVAVSIWKSGFTSAIVYVGTTAVIYDSNASLNNTGAGSVASNLLNGAGQPNTVVVSGLTGTSGDVVLKRKASKVVGYLRNSGNGTAVSGATLSLTATRNGGTVNNIVPGVGASPVTFEDQNMTNLSAGQHQAGTVVYGYEAISATTGSDAKFTFTDVPNATTFAIHINSENWYPVPAPANTNNTNIFVSGNAGANFAVNIAADGTLTPALAAGTLVRPTIGGTVASTILYVVASNNKAYATATGIPPAAPAGNGDLPLNQTNYGLTAVQPAGFNTGANFNSDPSGQALGPALSPIEGTQGANCLGLNNATVRCGSHWLVTLNHNETLSVGNLFASNIFSFDNINPYVATVDNAFELQWGFPYVSLDDTVNLRTVPLRLIFSEEIQTDRMDFNDDGANNKNAISVLLFFGNQGAIEERIYVDGAAGKTQLQNVGGRAILDIYAELTDAQLTTLKGGAYLYVLLKQTDFRDTSSLANYLSIPPQANLGFVPDLYRATNPLNTKPVSVSNASLANGVSYLNYWRYQFKLYQEPDPTPRPTLPLPDLRQITCTNVIRYVDAATDTLSETAPPRVTVKRDGLRSGGLMLNGVPAFNGASAQTHSDTKHSGLCDYDGSRTQVAGVASPTNSAPDASNDYDLANVFQLNATSLAQLNEAGQSQSATRLTVLAKQLGAAASGTYPGWGTSETAQGGKVLTDVAFIEVGAIPGVAGAQSLSAGAVYRVTVSRTPKTIQTVTVGSTASTAQLAVVTDASGVQFDTAGKFYMAVSGSTTQFDFRAKDTMHRIWVSGLQVGDTIGVLPIRNAAGVTVSPDVNQPNRNNQVTLDDLTPPSVAIQSENYNVRVFQTGSVQSGVGEVPGEVLIQGGGTTNWYPTLRLTASLYSRTTNRAARGVDGTTTPLLRLSSSGPTTGRAYSEADFENWETATRTTSTNEFDRTVRDVIIEMTEKMEDTLTYNSLNNAGAANDRLGYGPNNRTMVIEPTEANILANGGGIAQLGGTYPVGVTSNTISTTTGWAAFDRFVDANAGTVSLNSELWGLRSNEGSSPATQNVLVATLTDWRNVAHNSLLTMMGLRDDNRNEVVRSDIGVVFQDMTPPMARRAVLAATSGASEMQLQIVFDQPIQVNVGERVLLQTPTETGAAVYTFTFTSATAATVSLNENYTDARNRTLLANQTRTVSVSISAPVTIATTITQANGVAYSRSTLATTLTFAMPTAALDVSSTTPDFRAYFNRLGNNPWVIWEGVGDTVTNNRWGQITARANTTGVRTAEKNDAYFCLATTNGCLSPAIETLEFITPKLANYSFTSELFCHDVSFGNPAAGSSTTGTGNEAGGGVSASSCYTLSNDPGLATDNTSTRIGENAYLHVDIRHTVPNTTFGTQLNSMLPIRRAMRSSSAATTAMVQISSPGVFTIQPADTIDAVEARTYLTLRNTDRLWSANDSGRADFRIGNQSATTAQAFEIDANVATTSTASLANGTGGYPNINNGPLTVTRNDESYEITLTFREPVRCSDQTDDPGTGAPRGALITNTTTECANLAAVVANSANAQISSSTAVAATITESTNNGRQTAGSGNTPPYTRASVTLANVDAKSIKVSFTLRKGGVAQVGDYLQLTGVRDQNSSARILAQNPKAGMVRDSSNVLADGVVRLTLLSPDNGAKLEPQDIVWGR